MAARVTRKRGSGLAWGLAAGAVAIGAVVVFAVPAVRAANPPAPTPPAVSLALQSSGLTVTATASAAVTATGASIAGYSWRWGDGATTTGAPPQSHTYAAAGSYTVAVTVTDSNGLMASASASATVTAPAPAPRHIFLLVMENAGAPDLISQPPIQALMSQFGAATNYSGVTQPSLPNYLALTAGTTAMDSSGDYPSGPFSSDNLFAQLQREGIGWGAYAEGWPGNLGTFGQAANVGAYIQHHFPVTYFSDLLSSPSAAANIHDLSVLKQQLAGPASVVPQFVWITPNDSNDDNLTWLQSFVGEITASDAWKQGGTLIVTWDNQWNYGPWTHATNPTADVLPGFTQAPDTNEYGGNVLTLVISPDVTPGTRYTQVLSHYSTLAAIETSLGLPLLGNAASAPVWTQLEALLAPSASTQQVQGATLASMETSAPGINPSITSRSITAAATGTGQVGFAWLSDGDFYVTASPGAAWSAVTLSACGVFGPFGYGGSSVGTFDAATGCATWTLTPGGTPGPWADIVR